MESGAGDSQAAQNRRWKRYPLNIVVRFSIPRSDGVTKTCTGYGTDISQGGMALQVKEELKIGRKVRVAMTLPNSQSPITCDARVCNRDGYRYGVEFTWLKDADREQLIKACESFSAETGDAAAAGK